MKSFFLVLFISILANIVKEQTSSSHKATSYTDITLLNGMGKEIIQQTVKRNKEIISLQNDLKP